MNKRNGGTEARKIGGKKIGLGFLYFPPFLRCLLLNAVSGCCRCVVAGLIMATLGCSDGGPLTPVQGPTRPVATAFGVVHVPVNPQRVVNLSQAKEDIMIALGVPPAGVTRHGKQSFPPEYDRLVGDHVRAATLVVGQYMDIGYETILVAQPDLIIGDEGHGVGLSRLSRIAPTALFTHMQTPRDLSVSIADIAAVLGLEERAKDVLAAHQRKVADARQVLNASSGSALTVAYVRLSPRAAWIAGSQAVMGQVLYDELGLRPPSGLPSGDGADISYDRLATIAPDRLIVELRRPDDRMLDDLAQYAFWRDQPAVRAGRVYPRLGWSYMGFGPLGRGVMIDDVVRNFGN